MTTQENKPNSADELNRILTGYAKYVKNVQGLYSYATEKKLSKKQAEAALNAYILAEILAIIGEDKPITGHMRPQGYPTFDMTESYRTEFRAELRKAAIARFGKGEE